MSQNRDRLLEYEKTLDLFMSESRLAWELVSIWIVIQTGLGSASVLLHSREVQFGAFSFTILFSFGMISCFFWCLMLYRNFMWRNNWLLYGLRIERELRTNGIQMNFFEFENRIREEKIALVLRNNEIEEQPQRFREQFGALRLAHYGMFIFGIFWSILFLCNLFIGGNISIPDP